MSEPTATMLKSPAYRRTNVKSVTSLAMLTAIAYVVMLLSKLLPQISGFLQLDLKDTIICIGGFVFGPLSAAAISIVVSVVEMFTVSDTGPIGLIMNLLATCSFCCTASFVYRKHHTKGGAILGLSLGVLTLTAVMLLWNYLITPLYMGISREAVTAMLVPIMLPFNLVKGGLNMAIILLLYKPIVSALRKAKLAPASQTTGISKQSNAGYLLFSAALLATFIALALTLMGIL